MTSPVTDWGNAIQRAFIDSVITWEPRLVLRTANGFFKASIRKHPTADLWSWGLEWNKKIRITGFFGDEAQARSVASEFPTLEFQTLIEDGTDFVKFRQETLLPESEDTLFVLEGVDNR